MEPSGLTVARALVYLTLLPAAGLPLYFLTAGRVAAVTTGARRAVAVLALLAGLASLWWLVASVAAMADVPLSGLDRETIASVASATPLRTVLTVRLIALAVLIVTILPRLPILLPALAGLAALGSAAFTGHAGATEGTAGTFHRLSDVAHLAGAACWIGALALFMTGALRGSGSLEARLARFAAAGTGIVAVLFLTGLANLLLIAGWPLPLTSTWSLVLGGKLALFAGMLGLAALNRWKLTPALASGLPNARGRLRVSLTLETGCAIAIVLLVSLLGTLDPAGA